MQADWNVEEALNEVVDAINEGSGSYLNLTKAGAKTVKNGYRKGFKEQRSRGQEWCDVKDTILGLSRVIGYLASILTVGRYLAASNNARRITRYTDLNSVLLAGYWVAKRYCPSASKGGPSVRIAGAFCPDPDLRLPANTRQRTNVDKILRSLNLSPSSLFDHSWLK